MTASPWRGHDLGTRTAEGRFAAPVYPGERLDVDGWDEGEPEGRGEGGAGLRFEVVAGGRTAVSGGRARFRSGNCRTGDAEGEPGARYAT